MTKTSLLGPWVRRFLLEYLVTDRNLTRNTQRSYRDTLRLLLPVVAQQAHKQIDQISVNDVSPDTVRIFLRHLEESRKCTVATRNQRLAAIRSLARFYRPGQPRAHRLVRATAQHSSEASAAIDDYLSREIRNGCVVECT
jgi:integrase/recombinase XerD